MGTVSTAIGAAAFSLVLYNVRWKYLVSYLRGQPRVLPVVKVDAENGKRTKKVPIVLLHGMWHDTWYFEALQTILARHGYSSYAISLKPGERLLPGGGQIELVRDLEATLNTLNIDRFVILGHSQGGLLAQSAVWNSRQIHDKVSVVVLLGTFPLGYAPSMAHARKLMNRPNMFRAGYAGICFFGKLFTVSYTKHIFLMPATDETTTEMRKYMNRVLTAPSDGLITTSHTMEKIHKTISDKPTLVLGAEGDVIYPPDLLQDAFQERFPNAKQIVAKGQAHGFVDPGWETNMASPLVEWLDTFEQLGISN